ncbi:MAG TPA: ROK family protein [Thermomicrobiales bacterium]|nr:ROK family protein [Thermomicrobiales bacterium]
MARTVGLGIDLGGTKILAGVIDLESGEVLATAKKKTRAERGPDELLDRLGDVAEEALAAAALPEDAALRGAGVAAAGQVDPARGVLIAAPNLGGDLDLPIGAALGERLGVPVALGNDVQVAALGELHFGAGRGVDRLLCVFVGTGVGGALLRDGELDRGATATAGEIGHTTIDAGGRHCGCGGRGHLEAYASRTAITRILLDELRRGRPSILTKLLKDEGLDDEVPGATAIRSGMLAKAVAAEDELTLETLREAAHYLGLGLASAINFYNPRRIVLGGGVVEAVPMLLDVARQVALREALPVPGAAVEIVPTQLGDDAGITGAALLGARATPAEHDGHDAPGKRHKRH